MRLCQPSFLVDTALLLDPSDLIVGEDIFEDPVFSTHLPLLINSHLSVSSDLTYRSRFLLHSSFDSFGLSGLLVLPQSFWLVCTALYSDGNGERKYLPQFFKFIVANSLSRRTKVRVVKETTYLEPCIESHTNTNLYMDQVEFEPAPNWSAKILKADKQKSEDDSPSREIFKPPVLVTSDGGIHNYLYPLSLSSHGSHTAMFLPTMPKEIELHVVEVPSVINLDRPFLMILFELFDLATGVCFIQNLIATKVGV